METPRPSLSVVIPFLDEEASIPVLFDRFSALEGLPPEHELIFVSDGSTDSSCALVEKRAQQDRRVKLVVLTRNFGHQAAICAGLDRASGAYVGVMDADLQDSPELLVEMHRTAVREGLDVVYCRRARRSGSWAKRLSYWAFYKAYAYAAETPVDPDSGDFCVLSRRAVETLALLPERVRFVRGLRSWMGLRAQAVSAERPERAAGTPQYTWGRLASLALNGLTSFSARPLRLATIGGGLLCAAAFVLTAFYLAAFLLSDLHAKAPGFTTLVILMLFLSGMQLLMLGIIGEYIAQIFWEVKRRPTYLVARSVNLETESGR